MVSPLPIVALVLMLLSGSARANAIASASAEETGAVVGAALAFALVASLGVSSPVVVYLVAGARATDILDELKTWMIQHNAAIMTVLLLIIGTELVGDGITML